LLSEDAVRVKPGQRVLIDGWGGDRSLEGVVERVEPFGFTEVSALGIEEQRVNAIIDITSPHEQWQSLGHGYRGEPRLAVWESEDELCVPLSAWFGGGNRGAGFVDDDGSAELRLVDVGREDGPYDQILDGLAEGERIVLHPND